ncbi:sucrase ferredoxin [Cellulomonas persica]|uniref:Sucrase ferredoxin n=1 Tax=Cellulomonas persica TaxID=76861 RepID=A0A510UVL7_9CELL|nr:sucrase ferredoxin [Cellulomonas persica]GEK18732.1 sucrase ferredoxin [Cellulomonas persica]
MNHAWVPCSDGARARQDSLVATGSHGDRWFLVENQAGWGRHALLDPPFDPALGRALVHRIEGAGIRPLAIRRPGRRVTQTGTRWALVDSRPGQESVRWGQVADVRDLLDVPLDGPAGTPSDRPVLAVCAHGRHDRCCAVRGRVVAARLAAAYPEETWECSHLGGDRFAGTMVLLPHGLYYGWADDADAAAIVDAYLAGRVDPRFLRGRSAYSHPVQAAQHFARAERGDDTLDAYAPLHEERTGDGWSVQLSTPDGPITVRLVETQSEPLLSTCAATRPLPVRRWILDAIEPRPTARGPGVGADGLA